MERRRERELGPPGRGSTSTRNFWELNFLWCSPKLLSFVGSDIYHNHTTSSHGEEDWLNMVGSTMMRLSVLSNSLLSLPFPATVALLVNAWSSSRVCCFCWHHQPPTPTLMHNRLRTSSTLPFAHLHITARQHGYFPLNKKRNCMTIENAHYRQLSHVNFGCTSDEIDVSRYIRCRCLHSNSTH